jgi:hypothetical protein
MALIGGDFPVGAVRQQSAGDFPAVQRRGNGNRLNTASEILTQVIMEKMLMGTCSTWTGRAQHHNAITEEILLQAQRDHAPAGCWPRARQAGNGHALSHIAAETGGVHRYGLAQPNPARMIIKVPHRFEMEQTG